MLFCCVCAYMLVWHLGSLFEMFLLQTESLRIFHSDDTFFNAAVSALFKMYTI